MRSDDRTEEGGRDGETKRWRRSNRESRVQELLLSGTVARGKQEETAALDIHSPVHVLFIASPL